MSKENPNFYDRWLNMWNESLEQKAKARVVIHDEELEWIETPQDYRIALMAGPENGFRTWGTEVTIADIPAGHHTGKHEHGEEGIYIVEGEGFSVVNDLKFPWETGSVLWMPFGSQHQHFNTGMGNARYLSFTALNLEHFAGLGRVDQWEQKGFSDTPNDTEASSDGLDRLGRRISIAMADAPVLTADPEGSSKDENALETPLINNPGEPNPEREAAAGAHRDWSRGYMRRFRGDEDMKWRNMELEISNSMGELPGRHGGKHAHMEAYLYIIDGEGYTVADGQRVDWKKGSLVHVQGPQTAHQHFNTGDKPNAQLRLAPGIRYGFFQPIARERFPYLVWGGRGGNDEPAARGH